MTAESLREQFKNNNQEHVFTFFSQLGASEQKEFLDQAEQLDLKRIERIYQIAMKDVAAGLGNLEPLPNDCFESTIVDKNQPDLHAKNTKIASYESLGLNLISQGKVAVLLLAGGQGTRLGSSAPKGCYDINLPSHKSLFQLQGERILRVQTIAAEINKLQNDAVKSIIPWYVMTSRPTRKETFDFFVKNNFFGLKKENVIFFEQGVLPCLTNDGKIMLEDKGKIAIAPDGNGGVYAALEKEKVLADMKKRGIEHIHMYCVDNCLVRVADPVFLGYCASKKAECGAKVVRKINPEEPVTKEEEYDLKIGWRCLQKDGKFQVVEYSEIDKKTTELRDETGQLAFRAGNVANHYYSYTFLEKIVKEIEPKLGYHVAKKKIPTIDYQTGALVKPTTPNGLKMELFVFDVFPFTSSFVVLEVAREEDFSPLKNAPGTNVDSPETSRRDIMAQHVEFLKRVGAKVLPTKDTNEIICEISPLVSYGGENLHSLSGLTLQCPIIINNEADLKKLASK